MVLVDEGEGTSNYEELDREGRHSGNSAQPSQPRGGERAKKYRGITWKGGKWVAQIQIGDRKENLGAYPDATAAAQAYDKRATELGRFDRLNFGVLVDEGEGSSIYEESDRDGRHSLFS